MVSHLAIDIESINIVDVFLDSTCLLEIIELIESPVQLIVVAIVLSNGILKFFTGIKPILIRFPQFQSTFFCS